MATYNQWMNQNIYVAAAGLSSADLKLDRKAFFGSILGTLNHIAVGDTIWLRRFAKHPAMFKVLLELDAANPQTLSEQLFPDLELLSEYRKKLDATIIKWVASITEADFSIPLNYKNMKGVAAEKDFFSMLMHFFNHQTHHRGQVSTLLFQAGVDIGVTDLLAVIPNE
jgi:uncharacterized damage-inducible protein DinB